MRNISLEQKIWAETGIKKNPDTDTLPGADLLTISSGNTDVQGPFSEHMNWWQNRADQLLNLIEKQGVLEYSNKTNYSINGLCKVGDIIYISKTDDNKNNLVTNQNHWKIWTPRGMGDMLKSVYDSDGDGVVDSAEEIKNIKSAGSKKYYGTTSDGSVGFYDLPPDGDMKKSVYDSDGDGVVDKAKTVAGALSAGNDKYFGTNSIGAVGFHSLPADGDMKKSVYDTTNNGIVDSAESINGVNAAQDSTFYGKNKLGVVGIHKLVDELSDHAYRPDDWSEITSKPDFDALYQSKVSDVVIPNDKTVKYLDGDEFYSPKNKPAPSDLGAYSTADADSKFLAKGVATAADVGALASDGTAANSGKLGNKLPDATATSDTIVARDALGAIAAKTIATNIDTTQSIADTAAISFRNNNTDDSDLNFAEKANIKKWLQIDNVSNYPISHIYSGSSKTRYASEFAVGEVNKTAETALDKINKAYEQIAGSCERWSTPRNLRLMGDVSGNVLIDGSTDVTLTATVADNSHSHTMANITDLVIADADENTKGIVQKATDTEATNGNEDTKFITSKQLKEYGGAGGVALITGTTYSAVGDEPELVVTNSQLNSVTTNSTYVFNNPFGNNTPVIVLCELLYAGRWADPCYIYSSGGYGAKASYVKGIGINLQSGNTSIVTVKSDCGTALAVTNSVNTGFQCRIWIQKRG